MGEFFNKRCFLWAILWDEKVEKCFPKREPLDTLGAPFWGNLRWVYSPKFFSLIFEEHGIEYLAETVDVEILK